MASIDEVRQVVQEVVSANIWWLLGYEPNGAGGPGGHGPQLLRAALAAGLPESIAWAVWSLVLPPGDQSAAIMLQAANSALGTGEQGPVRDGVNQAVRWAVQNEDGADGVLTAIIRQEVRAAVDEIKEALSGEA